MTDKPLHELSIAECGAALRDGSVTSRQLTEDALARIATIDPQIDSFIEVTGERALADADAADAAFAAGKDAGPMQGVPYALKDIYNTKDIRTTCHSKLMLDHVPAEDCVVAEKLRNGGGVLLGKLATHEFAFGGPSFDLPFPPAKNPWIVEHWPGGSSSGSGAAVAAGLCRMAMGSDTGGSIRGPASYCGTIGHKPTYGLVSRRGIFPLSFTLDHAGPLSWTVEDTAITMQVIAGHDPLDPASADPGEIDFLTGLHDGVEGMKLAFPKPFFENEDGLDPEVADSLNKAADTLKGLGAIVEIIDLPEFDLFNAAGRTIIMAEAYAIHEKNLKSRLLDYGLYTSSRMACGALVSAGDLTQAFRVRRKLSALLNNEVFGKYDAMFTANTLQPAVRFDSFDPKVPGSGASHTMAFNLTGNPAMSIPTGFNLLGLPMSMQIVGKPFGDATVLRVGQAFEQATGLSATRPSLATVPAEAAA